jgi:voltage-gated potassium channel
VGNPAVTRDPAPARPSPLRIFALGPILPAMKKTLNNLYTGRSRAATQFRYGLIALDLVTILFFILTAPLPPSPGLYLAEAVVGVLILTDLCARLWIAPDRRRMLTQIYTLADLVVIASLVLAPILGANLAFLKVLRALRLIHSYQVLRDLRRHTAFFREHEEAVLAAVNLLVFIFVSASVVFVLQFDNGDEAASYIDALYFTVATLTTTGYGDLTMTTPGGKLLSVFMMVMGVALFFRLARAIFLPTKVRHTCPDCGLNRHDVDAIHCKHCGDELKIETGGAS